MLLQYSLHLPSSDICSNFLNYWKLQIDIQINVTIIYRMPFYMDRPYFTSYSYVTWNCIPLIDSYCMNKIWQKYTKSNPNQRLCFFFVLYFSHVSSIYNISRTVECSSMWHNYIKSNMVYPYKMAYGIL